MLAVDGQDLWRQIPPEEKFELMAQAQSRGVLWATVLIVTCATVAVGLQYPWLLWGSLITSPLVFQFASSKAFRHLRPKVMLEHLAARSAARRYAFSLRSSDLTLVCVFKGMLEELFTGEDSLSETLEMAFSHQKVSNVWVALFSDSVVMMSERAGGADLRFGHLINEELEVKAEVPSGEKEYSPNHAVILSYQDKYERVRRFKLTSRFPAALIVFEKNLQKLKIQAKTLQLGLPAVADQELDEFWQKASSVEMN